MIWQKIFVMDLRNNPVKLLSFGIIISLIGFLDALYLMYMEISGDFRCLINGGVFQCDLVNTSSFAKLFGVHISIWGALFYLSMIIFLLIAVKSSNPYWVGFVIPISGLFGALFSIYLTCIEAFVIYYYCEFCLLSAICTWILCLDVMIIKWKKFSSFFAHLDFWNFFKKSSY